MIKYCFSSKCLVNHLITTTVRFGTGSKMPDLFKKKSFKTCTTAFVLIFNKHWPEFAFFYLHGLLELLQLLQSVLLQLVVHVHRGLQVYGSKNRN
jgi:hypothetical protein